MCVYFQVSKLGFGCGALSGMYNAPLSHEEGCFVLNEAFSKGITFFDTSDLYGELYDNEIMVGKVCTVLKFNYELQYDCYSVVSAIVCVNI